MSTHGLRKWALLLTFGQILHTQPLRATDQTVDGDLTVIGSADIQGNSLTFGRESVYYYPGMEIFFTDATLSTPSSVEFNAGLNANTWKWQHDASTSLTLQMTLDQNNVLKLYDGTLSEPSALITLNPFGTSTFENSVVINGEDNQMPNQTVTSGSSILTVDLADLRYLSLNSDSFSLFSATATGSNSIAFGWGAEATGSDSFASFSIASGQGSTAMGGSIASGTSSMALGGALASGDNSMGIGNYSTASGNGALALGISSVAQGTASAAVAGGTAAGQSSTAIGSSYAAADYSLALGGGTAQGDGSSAIGWGATASGGYAAAIGWDSLAGGGGSTAFSNSMAYGANSTAMGYYANASGISSTAIGYYSYAYGTYSVALGNSSATGEISTSMGSSSATGCYSTSMGMGTIASSFTHVALGRYNVGGGDPNSWQGTDPLFEIGNGNDEEHRSNALSLDKSGNLKVNTVTVISPGGDIPMYVGH